MSYGPTQKLPRWLEGPGCGGTWKNTPDEFVVIETLEQPPTGRGPWLWLRVEKLGLTTPDVAELLARAAGVTPDEVTYAGLKDREARAIQHFTIRCAGELRGELPGVKILQSGRTEIPMEPGAHDGNKFSIVVRGGDARRAIERLDHLKFMPNYYGPQRVGGDAPKLGKEILLGRAPRNTSKARLRFAVAAYQATLFNAVLAARGRRRIPGDIEVGGIPTGPMFGPGMQWPGGECGRVERQFHDQERLPYGAWQKIGDLARGHRRPLWVRVKADVVGVNGGFRLDVMLPAGTYATALLEEIV